MFQIETYGLVDFIRVLYTDEIVNQIGILLNIISTNWLNITISDEFTNVILFWLTFSGMAIRGERQHYKTMEQISGMYSMSDDKLVWWIKRYTLAALKGPISVIERSIISTGKAIRWISSAIKKRDRHTWHLAGVYTWGSAQIMFALFSTVLANILLFTINAYLSNLS